MNRIETTPTRLILLAALGSLMMAAVTTPARGTRDNWNCNLQCYWGALGESPADVTCFFGVRPGAVDDLDYMDCLKPYLPLTGYPDTYAWFPRSDWGLGFILCDMRATVAEGSSKVWGTGGQDTWNVVTTVDNGPSGVSDECGWDELPLAASVYIAWEFGVCQEPALMPPPDHTFVIKYVGGINPKPPGTALPDAEVPVMDQTWDMETVPYIVIPLWANEFTPPNEYCTGVNPGDVARFKMTATNPATNPTCTLAADPLDPLPAPATFDFTATACCDAPFSFDWDFGDGDTASGNPVSHTYTVASTYTVACTVGDVDEEYGTCTMQVTVTPSNEPPTCAFDYAPASPLVGESTAFTDLSVDLEGAIASWAWDFGDGGTATEQHPAHTYSQGGCFNVSLTVTDADGAESTCEQCVPVRSDTEVPLCKAGWHMIAQPHAGDHALAEIFVRDDGPPRPPEPPMIPFCDATGAWVMNPLFYYDIELMGYGLCGCDGVPPPSHDHTLRMGYGYWLYTFQDYLTLVFP